MNFPRRGFEAAHQRGAVALAGHVDDPGAEAAGDLLGAVGGAVVGDQDLAARAGSLEALLGHPDALADRLLLVEAGHHDRDLDLPDAAHRRHRGRGRSPAATVARTRGGRAPPRRSPRGRGSGKPAGRPSTCSGAPLTTRSRAASLLSGRRGSRCGRDPRMESRRPSRPSPPSGSITCEEINPSVWISSGESSGIQRMGSLPYGIFSSGAPSRSRRIGTPVRARATFR